MSYSFTVTTAFAFETEEDLKAGVRRYMQLTKQPAEFTGPLEADGEVTGALERDQLGPMRASGINTTQMVTVIVMRQEQPGGEYKAIPLGPRLQAAPAPTPPIAGHKTL